MSKLNELISLCKCSVSVTINNHKDYYETITNYVNSIISDGYKFDDDVLTNILSSDSIVELQAYPDSPIGYYVVYHYDVEEAIGLMIETIKLKK